MARALNDPHQALRQHIIYLLGGGGAHVSFEDAVDGLPVEKRGLKPAGLPYSPWQVLEHMRIAQWDILDFSTNPDYEEPEAMEEYWPRNIAPATAEDWENSVRTFRSDLDSMRRLVADATTDLFAPIPWGTGQTILREALLVADHNGYHLGQLVLLRRLLGAWTK